MVFLRRDVLRSVVTPTNTALHTRHTFLAPPPFCADAEAFRKKGRGGAKGGAKAAAKPRAKSAAKGAGAKPRPKQLAGAKRKAPESDDDDDDDGVEIVDSDDE